MRSFRRNQSAAKIRRRTRFSQMASHLTPPASLLSPRLKTSYLDRVVTFLTSLTKILSFAVVSILILGATYALIAHHVSPKEMIVVQQLQIDDTSAKDLHLNQAILIDLITNQLNEIIEKGVAYKSSQLTNKTDVQPQERTLALAAPVKVPVQSNVDLSFQGISLAQLQNVYDYLRYERTTIRGDFTRQGNSVKLLLTLQKDGAIKTWERPVSVADSGVSDLHKTILAVMAEMYPELTGRMYLRDAAADRTKLADAGKIFTKWISVEPLNERPYYYLTAVYENLRTACITDEKGKCAVPRYGADPESLIEWLKEIENINDLCHSFLARIGCAIRSRIYSGRTASTSSLRAMIEAAEANNLLISEHTAKAVEEFQIIADAFPDDATAKLNLSVAQGKNNQGNQAIQTLTAAEGLSPENALIEYQLGGEAWFTGDKASAFVHERRALHFASIFADNSPVATGALRQYLLFNYTEQTYAKAADMCSILLLTEPEAFTPASEALSPQSQVLNRACAIAFAAADKVPEALRLLEPIYSDDAMAEQYLRKSSGTLLLGQNVNKNFDAYQKRLKPDITVPRSVANAAKP
jgi:hypothetical protein